MEIIFTKHIIDKLRTKEAKIFKITKIKIKQNINKPILVEELNTGIIRSVSQLGKQYSLCVIYKIYKAGVKAITFFPAEKGRY